MGPVSMWGFGLYRRQGALEDSEGRTVTTQHTRKEAHTGSRGSMNPSRHLGCHLTLRSPEQGAMKEMDRKGCLERQRRARLR